MRALDRLQPHVHLNQRAFQQLRETRTTLEGEYLKAQGLLQELATLRRELEDVEWVGN